MADNCGDDGGSGGGDGAAGLDSGTDPTDPLSSLAHSCAKAAAWAAKQLGKSVGEGPGVDFTNGEFLRQYAIVFAAATVLVLVVWLMAVAKRAMRGVPFTEAFSEAIGLLWLAVGATAFTPLILYTLIGATSEVTDVIVKATGGEPGGLFVSLGKALTDDKLGGGPVVLIVASLVTILLCGALWLVLFLRALGLYVGAVLGVIVYAGLVDRDLWGHVRRWAGVMLMLVLMEPVIMIVLGLAAVLQAEGSVATGLGVTALALGVAVAIITKAPGAGDAIRAARTTARAARSAGGVVLGSGGAAAGVMHGIHTHGGRGGAPQTANSGNASSSNASSSSGGVSGGMAAHSQRNSPRRGNAGGRGGGGGSSVPRQKPASPPKGNDE
ncbi:hypothetical protein ABZ820_33805 [Streptomyces diacarni]|uniref:hypothetical protein n=1 Tax=Streptomyces diacarni TaxID=2800381 RepID=UPI0033D67E0F